MQHISKEKEQQYQQYMELEKEVMGTLAKVRQYEASMTQLKKNIQKCQITLKELGSIEEQKTYQPVGKCFILKPKKDIANEVLEIIKSHEKDIDEYEKVRQHLITKGKEKETQLQEAMKALKI
ncbi:unnamed protein product (macronuclear) [Paramecium tetraurelia]|uniref:Uncharacterized protein n=1 Tax=Paramecium tetraurelia TaxID=5888 RepID=A0DV77_PARTE|nr:uncharacterized protein GSPATT00020608001 [Paramecium tetraurelia]CAK86944.1 unnamed protein product [Paramecium tetraurelia]|eukprot:XP_001454341.1 hypothetical protein (macronuclear) [Paramecium tetraurelia strain d4-2]